jgi:hypothetical protein
MRERVKRIFINRKRQALEYVWPLVTIFGRGFWAGREVTTLPPLSLFNRKEESLSKIQGGLYFY